MSENGSMDGYLIGVRLRPTAPAEDYRLGDLTTEVGDLVLVEASGGTTVGEVRRSKRPLPEGQADRAYPRVLRPGAFGPDRGEIEDDVTGPGALHEPRWTPERGLNGPRVGQAHERDEDLPRERR